MLNLINVNRPVKLFLIGFFAILFAFLLLSLAVSKVEAARAQSSDPFGPIFGSGDPNKAHLVISLRDAATGNPLTNGSVRVWTLFDYFGNSCGGSVQPLINSTKSTGGNSFAEFDVSCAQIIWTTGMKAGYNNYSYCLQCGKPTYSCFILGWNGWNLYYGLYLDAIAPPDKPDYVIKNGGGGTSPTITISDPTPDINQSVTITARTYNQGPGNAVVSSKTRATANGGASVPSKDFTVIQRTASNWISHSYAISWNSAGSKRITFRADINNNISETNEGNNYVWRDIAVNSPPVAVPTCDIRANASNGPITIAYNTSATISWTSNNATSGTISPPGWSGTSGSRSSGNLTSSVTYTCTVSGPGGSGTDTVRVNVSPPPVNKPDLVVTDISRSGALTCGNPVSFTATIRNQGNAPASVIFGTSFRLDLNAGSFSYPGDRLLGAPPTQGGQLPLNPGASTTEQVNWTVVDGTHYLRVYADWAGEVGNPGQVDEKNENNNYRDLRVSVDCGPSGKPDYVIRNSTGGTSPDISGPTSVCVNTSALYRARTYNVGTAAATSNSTTRVTASGGASNSLQNYGVGGLSVGSLVSHSFTTSWATTGGKTISFRADVNGQVAESNEGNNVELISVVVNACGGPVVDPDIVAHSLNILHESSGLSVTSVPGEEANPNEPLVAELDYDEHNGVQATNFEAWFWKDRVSDPYSSEGCSPSGRDKRKTGLSTLLPAFTRSYEYIPFDAPGSVGNKSAWQFIDATCKIKEESDNNNTDRDTYPVGTPLSFEVTITPGNHTVDPGDSAVYTVTVDPKGTGFSGNVNLSMLTAANLTANDITYSFSPVTVTVPPGNIIATSDLTVTSQSTTNLDVYDLRVRGVSGALSDTGSATFTVEEAKPNAWIETKEGSVGVRGDIDMQDGTPPSGEYNADYTVIYNNLKTNFESAKNWTVQYSSGFNSESLEASTNIYDDLMERYKSRGTKAVDLSNRRNIMNRIRSAASSGSGILAYRGSPEFRDSAIYSGRPAIVFIDGDLLINRQVRISNTTSLVFVVSGDVNVDDDVRRMDGFYIADGHFNSKARPSSDKQLTVNGSAMSFSGFDAGDLGRDLSENSDSSDDLDPSEVFNYAPRYLWILRDVLGESTNAFKELAP